MFSCILNYVSAFWQSLFGLPNPDALPELPFEIITEILSWLPVDALLRFKCVCKQWHCLLLDYKFIAKHWDRARPLQLSYQQGWESHNKWPTSLYDANFKYLTGKAGLLLEKSRITSRVFRIRNFATHQVVYLPDADEGTFGMGFVFDYPTGQCKVTCFYVQRVGETVKLGVKVLSIGKDDDWRTLKLPNQNDKRFRKFYHCGVLDKSNAAHLVEFIEDGEGLKLQVQSFDPLSECFAVTTLPRGAFLDLKTVAVFLWKYYVAVGEIVEESLNVWVLENNFKEQKWRNIIVPLKFLKDNPGLKDEIRPHTVWSDDLHLHNAVKNKFILYDMKRGVIKETCAKSTQKRCFSGKPSLVTLKGMKNEN